MRYPIMTALAAAATVLSISPAQAGPDDPLFKLLPDDGATFKIFGSGVAISGNIAIIGAMGDTVNGTNSGAAYLFNVATGQQLFKLVPGDGAVNDRFGITVAISGTTAIVGATGDDDNGSDAGSAYLFDTTTGLQIGAKLLASDGVGGDFFGTSVAIDGTIAVVGARTYEVIGFLPGSAYLFDTTTGLEVGKLRTDITSPSQRFGSSVAISGTTVIVGATQGGPAFAGSAFLFDITNPASPVQFHELVPDDGELGDQFGIAVGITGTPGNQIAIAGANFDEDPVAGIDAGSAYLFDVFDGSQLFKLLPDDAQFNDRFGNAVAISGDIVLVGAHGDDDNGANSGSAYLFDISTPTSPTQLRKLLPIDGEADDGLGLSVSIDGPPGQEVAIVGSRKDDDQGSLSGSAYLTAHDTDSDGLLDSWEINGIPYINSVSGLDLLYLLPGADWMHKDLYVEIDLDVSQLFPLASRQLVVDAFAQSPVTNPDFVNGVTLHILYDEDLVSAAFFTTFTTGPQVGWAIEFDGLKDVHFGTPAERAVSDPAALLEAKAKAYRYCIFADQIDDGSLGTAELPGNDLFLTLGQLSSPPDDTKTASVFMHEFGHTLGLGHGGSDDINGKTNYISIMNYVHVIPQAFSTAFWKLDYSRFQLPTLDESSLDENDGINPSIAFYANVFAPHGFDMPDGSGGFTRRAILISLAPGNRIDWNQNGSFTDTSVMQDLNYVGAGSPFAGISSPSFPQDLTGHDDWSNLKYGIGTSGDFADLIHTTTPPEKPSQAMIDWINANIPLPPVVCLADINGDTIVNITDLLAMLAAWGPNSGHAADISGDGTVNVIDLLAMLASWGVCP